MEPIVYNVVKDLRKEWKLSQHFKKFSGNTLTVVANYSTMFHIVVTCRDSSGKLYNVDSLVFNKLIEGGFIKVK